MKSRQSKDGREYLTDMKGTVKFFKKEQGYGFIEQTVGPDVFVHINDLKRCGIEGLEQGQPVQFDIQEGKKGLNAVNIVI